MKYISNILEQVLCTVYLILTLFYIISIDSVVDQISCNNLIAIIWSIIEIISGYVFIDYIRKEQNH